MSVPRLRRRLRSVRAFGPGRLSGRTLRFHKVGRDGSGKCDVVVAPDGVVFGVVFEIMISDLALLDRIEGVGMGYRRETLRVRLAGGGSVSAQTYVATAIDPRRRPFSWYLRHVFEGARAADFPADYLAALASTEAIRDPDRAREAAELSIYRG